jgi:hypothetical protein
MFRRVQEAPVERAASDRLGAARAAIAHFGVTVAPVVEDPVAGPVPPKGPEATPGPSLYGRITAKAAIAAELEMQREEKAAAKRGRPKVGGERPWEAAGMSRRTWYRKNAKATS